MEDWDHILASVEQDEDIEEAIEAMGAPAPAPAPAALGLGWLFSGSNDTAAFTWRSFCGWPVGVVQDTDDTLHILLCVREHWVFPRWIRCACSQLPFMSRPQCALPGTAMRRKIFSVSRKSEY